VILEALDASKARQGEARWRAAAAEAQPALDAYFGAAGLATGAAQVAFRRDSAAMAAALPQDEQGNIPGARPVSFSWRLAFTTLSCMMSPAWPSSGS
jgi:hypothetical protein